MAHGGVVEGANRKPKPSSSIECSMRSAGSSSSNPSASRTSAEPEADETERLPCFATPAPAAAATSAAAVEMLNVCAPSPPVPAVSTRSSRCGCTASTWRAHRLGAAGDLVRGLALDAQRDEERAHLGRRRLAAHDLVHDGPRLRPGQVAAVEEARERELDHRSPSRKRLPISGPSGVSTDSGWNWMPSTGCSRCRTAMTSPSSVVAHTSSESGTACRGQGVVAAALERAREASEQTLAVVLDPTRLAVDEEPGLPDLAAVGLDDRLVAETDAERGNPRADPPHDLDAGARVGRTPRPGRDDEMRGREALGAARVDRVVAEDRDIGPELLEQVRQVVREAVVVVDQQHARAGCVHAPASARSIAVSIARSLLRHSWFSAVGSESATTPAPACRWATPSREDDRAYADAGVERAAGRERVPHRSRVGTAAVALELRDDLHRPYLRRSGDGARRERGAEQVEGRDARPEHARHLGDEVADVRVALGDEEALDADGARPAHPGQVVATEVHEHDVLGAILLRGEQTLLVALAGLRRAGDRVHAGASPSSFTSVSGEEPISDRSPSSSRKR